MPIPAATIRLRHQALGEIMQSVMQRGTDYDEIPGTNKPTLLKAGAETLMSCFSLHPDTKTVEIYEPERQAELEVWETIWSGPRNDRKKERVKKTIKKTGYYEVKARCTLRSTSGEALGTLSGSCNSWEAKYVTQSLHDVKNTVLKMAEKRAIVAAVLAVTGASRIFTQDVEDMPIAAEKQPQPQNQAPAAPSNSRPARPAQPPVPPADNMRLNQVETQALAKKLHQQMTATKTLEELAQARGKLRGDVLRLQSASKKAHEWLIGRVSEHEAQLRQAAPPPVQTSAPVPAA